MTDVDITVHRLRLHVPPGQPTQALRSRIEDGLRISSKPAALAQRFILLRRLRVRLPRQASAQSLALQLEREWRALEAQAQPMARAAPDAAAVWAADETQARELLLLRWLAGQDSEAWFWRRLLPAVAPSQPLGLRLRALLFEPFVGGTATASSEAALRRAWWRQAVPRIVDAGQGASLLAPLSVAQCEQLSAAGAWLRPDAHGGSAQHVPVQARRAADASRRAPAPEPSEGAPPRAPSTELGREAMAADAAKRPPSTTSPRWPQPPAAAPSQRSSPSSADATRQGNDDRADAAAWPPVLADAGPSFDDWQSTHWAGLWLLLPLLLRLGLGRAPKPAPLLAAVLRQAASGVELDAPALQWIEQVAALDDGSDADLDIEAADWWRRARLSSLMQARLPLRRVLRRSGRVWLATHRIDVEMPLARADVRIRRAGFDIDPGFVPWLDCVLHFHYRHPRA